MGAFQENGAPCHLLLPPHHDDRLFKEVRQSVVDDYDVNILSLGEDRHNAALKGAVELVQCGEYEKLCLTRAAYEEGGYNAVRKMALPREQLEF